MKITIYGPMCSGKSTIASIIKGHETQIMKYFLLVKKSKI